MKNIVLLVIIVGIAWAGYAKLRPGGPVVRTEVVTRSGAIEPAAETALAFRCDGRTRCPQMRSCAEATHFIQHCPNTEMDGDNDGVPCERQWCN